MAQDRYTVGNEKYISYVLNTLRQRISVGLIRTKTQRTMPVQVLPVNAPFIVSFRFTASYRFSSCRAGVTHKAGVSRANEQEPSLGPTTCLESNSLDDYGAAIVQATLPLFCPGKVC